MCLMSVDDFVADMLLYAGWCVGHRPSVTRSHADDGAYYILVFGF